MNEKMAGFMKIVGSILLIISIGFVLISTDKYMTDINSRLTKLESLETRTANIESVITKLAIKHNDVVGYLKQQENKVDNAQQESPKNKSRLFSWFM